MAAISRSQPEPSRPPFGCLVGRFSACFGISRATCASVGKRRSLLPRERQGRACQPKPSPEQPTVAATTPPSSLRPSRCRCTSGTCRPCVPHAVGQGRSSTPDTPGTLPPRDRGASSTRYAQCSLPPRLPPVLVTPLKERVRRLVQSHGIPPTGQGISLERVELARPSTRRSSTASGRSPLSSLARHVSEAGRDPAPLMCLGLSGAVNRDLREARPTTPTDDSG